jgi:class 3 adenylate cyclase
MVPVVYPGGAQLDDRPPDGKNGRMDHADHTDYRLAAVLYMDIVGFRAMMAADERDALALLAESTQIGRASCRERV